MVHQQIRSEEEWYPKMIPATKYTSRAANLTSKLVIRPAAVQFQAASNSPTTTTMTKTVNVLHPIINIEMAMMDSRLRSRLEVVGRKRGVRHRASRRFSLTEAS